MSTGAHHVLAVDGGATKTVAALFTTAGRELARARGSACNLYQDPKGGVAAIKALWRDVSMAAGLDPGQAATETAVSAGLAGASAAASRAYIGSELTEFAALRLSGDGYTALVGAFGGKPGALISIGTGVVGCRMGASGSYRQLGGWGFPLGDRGGGAWLGLRLAGDFVEHGDGYATSGPEGPLRDRVAAELGATHEAILARLQAATPGDFAKLAPLVVDAAAGGDAYAQGLLNEAAAHLLRLARALGPAPAAPLCVAGGLAHVFGERLAAGLGPDVVDLARRADAIRGAYLVGTGAVPAEFG